MGGVITRMYIVLRGGPRVLPTYHYAPRSGPCKLTPRTKVDSDLVVSYVWATIKTQVLLLNGGLKLNTTESPFL